MLVLYLILAISVLKSFNVFRRARRAVCSLVKCRKRRISMSTRDEDHGLRLKQTFWNPSNSRVHHFVRSFWSSEGLIMAFLVAKSMDLAGVFLFIIISPPIQILDKLNSHRSNRISVELTLPGLSLRPNAVARGPRQEHSNNPETSESWTCMEQSEVPIILLILFNSSVCWDARAIPCLTSFW